MLGDGGGALMTAVSVAIVAIAAKRSVVVVGYDAMLPSAEEPST